MANKKPKYKQILTPPMEALWAHLDAPELYEGKPVGFTIMGRPSQEDFEALQAKILSVFEDACQNHPDFLDGNGKSKKVLDEPQIGVKVDKKTGDQLFKFRSMHEYKSKLGEIIARTVPIWDAKGSRIKVNIGNGSTIRVAFTPSPYWKSAKNNGVALYMDDVQVIKLVERGSQECPFEATDGYDGSDSNNPFDGNDEPIPGPTDKDF